MCGIIGYNGTKKCVPKLIGALEALEYRGYDSAGIAYIKKGNIEIKKEKGVYVVKSSKLEKVIKSTNFDDYESLNYFQNAITTSGLTDALKNAGIKPGDSVSVNGVEFEFFE